MAVNDLRTAVFHRLEAHFPNVELYGEEIKQGFEEPCFFVRLLTATHDQELDTRYMRTHSFDIHYFPTDGKNEEAHHVAEILYDVLEIIEIGGQKYRGIGMNHEIVDGVLHFFVDYNFHVRRIVPEVPKMGQLEQEGLIK